MAEIDAILSAEHTAAIGLLVVAVSKIDTLLTDLTAAILRTDILSAIAVIHHQQIANKVDTLKALILLHSARGTTDRATKLLNEAKDVADYRNSLVHAHWHIDKTGGTYAVRFQARGKISRSRKPVPVGQILSNAERANDIADQLAELRDHVGAQNATDRRSSP